jgi:hypothetical protein
MAGVKEGDIVIAFKGRDIHCIADFQSISSQLLAGAIYKMSVERGEFGKRLTLSLRTESVPKSPSKVSRTLNKIPDSLNIKDSTLQGSAVNAAVTPVKSTPLKPTSVKPTPLKSTTSKPVPVEAVPVEAVPVEAVAEEADPV